MKAEILSKLEKELEIISEQLAEKESELDEIRIKIITESFDLKVAKHIVIGCHECKDSPIGVCFYDSIGDPAWDDCLICGYPDERK